MTGAFKSTSFFFSSPVYGGRVGEADGGGQSQSAALDCSPSSVTGPQNRFENAIQILRYLVVPETHDKKAILFDESVPSSVTRKHCIASVLVAVEFNDESGFDAGKISYVRSDRVLAPKPQIAELPVLYSHPELALGDWHVAAKSLRKRIRFAHAERLAPSGPSGRLPRKRGRRDLAACARLLGKTGELSGVQRLADGARTWGGVR